MRDQQLSLITTMYSALVPVKTLYVDGEEGGPSLVWCFWLCERSLQVSAAFLLEPFVLPSAPSAFLELLEERLTAAAVFVSESISWVWLSPPSSSSCSIQHSCPVGGQGRSAPSW